MTLRSLLVGDTDHYLSPYIHGVAAASGRLGILHSQISIRVGIDRILRRIEDVRPHLLWTHMLLWPPKGSPQASVLLAACTMARRRYGTKVVIHDGDLKERTRFPQDISSGVDLALLNHRHPRTAWKVPTLYWPYACFPQEKLAAPVEALRCRLAFAGQLASIPFRLPGPPAGIYDARSQFVRILEGREVGMRVFDGSDGNTLLRTADLAVSAGAVLGYGRPGSDWVDNRVFQYPGAGGILLHDDVPDDAGMEPWDASGDHITGHYIPYESGNPDSVAAALDCLAAAPETVRQGLRKRAFVHGQKHHSYTARVQQVLAALDLEA
jgi:hypothetical protein